MIAEQIRRLLGPSAVTGTAGSGQPLVAPADEAGIAMLLRTAQANRWRVGIRGLGHWQPEDGPADLVLSTRRLCGAVHVAPEDLVATAQAGVSWSDLQESLAESGVWVGMDAPGLERSVGSVTATATSGTLSAGLGRVRDHVLGLTFVTGEGRIVRAGGTVVKNVAGYDLAKLAIGSFGAFGVLTSVTFRLRAVPRADRTLQARGPRDGLLEAAIAIANTGIVPSAVELHNPDATDPDTWSLAVRVAGRNSEVQSTEDAIRQQTGVGWETVDAETASSFWHERRRMVTRHPTTLRLGCVPTGIPKCCDTLVRFAANMALSISVPAGLIRATADFTSGAVHHVRRVMTEVEVPVTVERGPSSILEDAGHYGAYREGVGALVARLRRTFDPDHVLAVPLGADS